MVTIAKSRAKDLVQNEEAKPLLNGALKTDDTVSYIIASNSDNVKLTQRNWSSIISYNYMGRFDNFLRGVDDLYVSLVFFYLRPVSFYARSVFLFYLENDDRKPQSDFCIVVLVQNL